MENDRWRTAFLSVLAHMHRRAEWYRARARAALAEANGGTNPYAISDYLIKDEAAHVLECAIAYAEGYAGIDASSKPAE